MVLFLRPFQRLCVCFTLGNIFGEAGKSHCFSALVPHRKTPIEDPANRSVWPHDAISVVIRFVERPLRYGRENLFLVLRMTCVHPRFWRGIQALAAASPNFFVGGADIVHSGILIIAQPENFINVLRQLTKTLLAFPQSLLRLLALGNVAGHTKEQLFSADPDARRANFDVENGTVLTTMPRL